MTKKAKIEKEKLVEQAKHIAKPREKMTCLNEIRLYNSMVLGIQNYYQIATCISIDCRGFHRQVMTVLTNRMNTEKGSMLKREGGTMTKSEQERFGKSKMVRYVAGIDQMIYPIAYVKYKVAMPKRIKVCSYTAEGREPIHTELSLNKAVLYGLKTKKPQEDSIEVLDSSLSLFSAQKGKCAISGEEFTTAQSIACWYKKPKEQGGLERYKNMTLIHDRYLPLLQKTSLEQLKALAKTLKVTTKMMSKINSLRKLSGLPTIG